MRGNAWSLNLRYGYDLSSRNNTLYRGASVLIRLFSSSRASASDRVTVVSIAATRVSMWAVRGAPARPKYDATRFFRSPALPTYSTTPLASSMRYTPGRCGSLPIKGFGSKRGGCGSVTDSYCGRKQYNERF